MSTTPAYIHSGKAPLTGLMMAMLTGLATAVVLGVAYAFAVVYIPIVYLNMLLTMGFGAAIGGAVGYTAKLGHVRSRLMPSMVAAVCGLVGLYIAWGADALARVGVPVGGDVFDAFRPELLSAYMKFFYENGFWAIGHGVGNNNQQMVSGIALAAVWLAEAGIIVGVAAFVSWVTLGHAVYCEHCEKWARSQKNVQRLTIGMPDTAIAQIAAGDLSLLDAWPRANPADQFFVRLNLDFCDGCENSNYLTMERVVTQIDKKGNPKQVVTAIVKRMPIDVADVPRVRAAGHLAVPPPAAAPVADAPPAAVFEQEQPAQ
ncbi:MAG TPA: hypothetical protein VKB78_12255 [Pirellulales bacterium]|nr:hypothetical protein [Pirellulales bacterium]